MKTDNDFNEAHNALAKSGWIWLGCDEWRDPVDNIKYMTSTAYKVMVQRTKANMKVKVCPKCGSKIKLKNGKVTKV